MRADPRHRPLPPEPATLLAEGQVAEAIRSLRDSNGLSQRQARAWIDAHIDDNPVLRVELEARQRARRRRIFGWFLLADVLVAGLVIWYLLYLN